MAIFSAMNTAGSGLATMRSWLDVLGNNIANINTVEPTSGKAFQASYLQVQEIAGQDGSNGLDIGQGVEAVATPKTSAEGRLTYSPTNPLADKDGYVRMPDEDLSDQMGNLIMAQRAFQANAAVIDRAKDTYQAAIQIGKNR
jgi:flagellar basal-body rod protein FlgC